MWALIGMAIAGYVILFVLAFAGIDPAVFRAIWIWVEALTFTTLALTKSADALVSASCSTLKP